jgi:hypothetical protein
VDGEEGGGVGEKAEGHAVGGGRGFGMRVGASQGRRATRFGQ